MSETLKQVGVVLLAMVLACCALAWCVCGQEIKDAANARAAAQGREPVFAANWPPEPIPGQPDDIGDYIMQVEVPRDGTTVPQEFRCVVSALDEVADGDCIIVYRVSDPGAVFGVTELDAGVTRAEIECSVPDTDPGIGQLIVTHRRGEFVLASGSVDVTAERP